MEETKPYKTGQTRFFLVSQSFYPNVHDLKIQNSYRSDHSPIILQIKRNNFRIGRGLWKFNNSLLYDPNYVHIVKEVINKTKEQYASLVYNRENLNLIDSNEIDFTISDQLFLETLLTEIRGKTISYASFKKKETNKSEHLLSEDINKLEEITQTDEILEQIEKKKTDLRIIRQNKMRGQYIRSKTQWVEEGEKPSKYFINLETKIYVNKTIPKLIDKSGNIIENQKRILNEAKNYYKNLYSKNETIKSINLSKALTHKDIPKLSENMKESLEGEISFIDMTDAIKRKKNEKKPWFGRIYK